MRLIDADALKAYINDNLEQPTESMFGIVAKIEMSELVEAICKDIDKQPTVTPEIIHCRDCKKRMKLSCPFGITVFDAPDDDEFCSRAERREDETC